MGSGLQESHTTNSPHPILLWKNPFLSRETKKPMGSGLQESHTTNSPHPILLQKRPFLSRETKKPMGSGSQGSHTTNSPHPVFFCIKRTFYYVYRNFYLSTMYTSIPIVQLLLILCYRNTFFCRKKNKVTNVYLYIQDQRWGFTKNRAILQAKKTNIGKKNILCSAKF